MWETSPIHRAAIIRTIIKTFTWSRRIDPGDQQGSSWSEEDLKDMQHTLSKRENLGNCYWSIIGHHPDKLGGKGGEQL